MAYFKFKCRNCGEVYKCYTIDFDLIFKKHSKEILSNFSDIHICTNTEVGISDLIGIIKGKEDEK